MKTIKLILSAIIALFGIVMLVTGIKTMMWHVFLVSILAFILGYSLLNEKEIK